MFNHNYNPSQESPFNSPSVSDIKVPTVHEPTEEVVFI